MTLVVADRLDKLISRLASDHDGEVVATARAIGRTLKGAGLDWHDLAKAATAHIVRDAPSVAPDVEFTWTELALWCRDQDAGQLSPREREFVASMVRWRGEPTERQAKWLADIARRLAREEAAG